MTLEKERQTLATSLFDDWIEWLSRNRLHVDMTSAAAAGGGLSVTGIVLLKASMLDRAHPVEFSALASLALMVALPFLVAGVIIHWLWIKPLRRIVPSWVMIALLGSLLVVISAGAFRFYTKAIASNATPMTFETIGDFIRDNAKDGLGVFVVLSIFTLPITAAVYYAEGIRRVVRRWYNGPDPPSILSNHERT